MVSLGKSVFLMELGQLQFSCLWENRMADHSLKGSSLVIHSPVYCFPERNCAISTTPVQLVRDTSRKDTELLEITDTLVVREVRYKSSFPELDRKIRILHSTI